MKWLLLTITFFLFFDTIFAQKVTSINQAAERFFENEQFYKAAEYYKRALKKEPENLTANYQLAECYRELTNYSQAEYYYEKSLGGSNQRFPKARYYFALMKKFNGNYEEALNNFERFLEEVEDNSYIGSEEKVIFRNQAQIEREGCLLALQELSQPVRNHEFTILSKPINSPYNDFAPYVYQHDSSIIIASSRESTKGKNLDVKFGEAFADMFRFKREDSLWVRTSDSDNFSKAINTKFPEGSGIFNKANDKFYFTYCHDDLGGCQIFVSRLDGKAWSEPEPLNENINVAGYDMRHPSLSPGGDTLFFSSNRPGGEGASDIWISISAGNDSWGPPQNLGSDVNTSFREISPFFDYKEGVLFFASDGHKGYGGFDIYVTENENFTSTNIFNMGFPYNSNRDDAFLILGEGHGYLASNRLEGIGKFDIYTFNKTTDEEIIAEIFSDEAIAGRTSVFSTDYDFEATDQLKIEGIISHLVASRLYGVELSLTDEEEKYYKDLSDEDKKRIERIIKSRLRILNRNNLQAVREEDEFFYQQLQSGEKFLVDRMVNQYMQDYSVGLHVRLSEEERRFYDQLNVDSKEKVDQYIALQLKEYEELDLTDDYYKTLDEPDKTEVDNISLKFLTGKKNIDNLSLSYSSNSFLNDLDDEDRNKMERTIKNQVFTIAENEKFQIEDAERVFFENLTKTERGALNHMAQAFIISSMNNFEEHLSKKDLEFYNSLSSNQKDKLDKILAKRIQNLVKSDIYTFQAMRRSSKEQLLQLASVNLNSDFDQILKTVNQQGQGNLLELSDQEKQKFTRLIANASVLIGKSSSSGDIGLVDYFEGQSNGDLPEGTIEIGELTAEFLSEDFEYSSDLIVKESTQDLDSEPNRVGQLSSEDLTARDSYENQGTNSQMKYEDPTRGDSGQLVTREDQAVIKENNIPIQEIPKNQEPVKRITSDEIEYYNNLDIEKRKLIDKIVALRMVNDYFESNPEASPASDRDYFKALSQREKSSIKRLSKYLQEELSSNEANEIESDLNFYDNLSLNKKRNVNRFIVGRLYDFADDEHIYGLSYEDLRMLRRMNSNERKLLRNLQNIRTSTQNIFGNRLDLENTILETTQLISEVKGFSNNTSENLDVSGKLVEIKSGRPLDDYTISIVGGNGRKVKQTTTDKYGFFQFKNVPSQRKYSILSDEDGLKVNARDLFFIKEIKVIGSNAPIYNTQVADIYLNESKLNNTTKQFIDQLTEEYVDQPDVEINIDGRFSDVSEGNKILEDVVKKLRKEGFSQKRISYTVSKITQVEESVYTPLLNNRLIFNLVTNKKLDVTVYKTIVSRDELLVSDLAENLNVSEENLESLNDFKNKLIDKYTPIIVEATKAKNLSLDVAIDLSSVGLVQLEYKVNDGESVITIAEKFNIPEELIMEMNNLSSSLVDPGKVLKMYIRN